MKAGCFSTVSARSAMSSIAPET
ncbi:MAG: hypothetical protein ACHBNF_20460, partial [Chromatiales bacterium]